MGSTDRGGVAVIHLRNKYQRRVGVRSLSMSEHGGGFTRSYTRCHSNSASNERHWSLLWWPRYGVRVGCSVTTATETEYLGESRTQSRSGRHSE